MALGNNLISFECPWCFSTDMPRNEPKGLWCQSCGQKVEGCCIGSPLPPQKTSGVIFNGSNSI